MVDWHGSDQDNVGVALGIVGTIVALLMYLSPVLTMLKVRANKDVGGFSELPYAVALLNTAIWVCYTASTPGRVAAFVTNSLAFILEVGYCAIFWYYSKGDVGVRVKRSVFYAATTSAIIVFLTWITDARHSDYVSLLPGHRGVVNASKTLGLAGSVLTIAMYASPLSVMWEVIRTKSVEFMPLPLSAMTFVNCTVWTAYSFYVQDVYLGVPNALGVVLSTAQLLLYLCYRPGGYMSGGHTTLSSSNMEEYGAMEA